MVHQAAPDNAIEEARVSQAYRLTERAEADVEAIADFIAADSIDAAVKVVLALEEAFVLLAPRPGVGRE